MDKFCNADKDLERLVERNILQFESNLRSPLDEHGNLKFPGFITLAQAISIVASKYSADNPMSSSNSVEHALADYTLSICASVADNEINVVHPITKLSWTHYLKLIKRGMYDEAETLPTVGMDWLIDIPEVERWYKMLGINLDLSLLLADMTNEQLKASGIAQVGGNQTSPEPEQNGDNLINGWYEKAREIADELHLRDKASGAHCSLADMAERVANELRLKGIAHVKGGTVKRDALQGKKWKRPVPKDEKGTGGIGGMGGM